MAKVTATGLGFAAVAAKIGATQMPDQIALAAGPAAAAVSLSAISLFVSWAGPLAGPYLLVLACAAIGSLWPLRTRKTASRLDGWAIFITCTLTSTALTGSLATALDRYAGIPVDLSVCFVALVLAALGDAWLGIFDSIGKAIKQKTESIGGKKE